jgi:hypothetical protein
VAEAWPDALALGRLRLVSTETSADASLGTRARIPLEPPEWPTWTVALVPRALA